MKIVPPRQVCSLPSSAVKLVRRCSRSCSSNRDPIRERSPTRAIECPQQSCHNANCCSMHTSSAQDKDPGYTQMVKMSSFTLNGNGHDLKRFLEEVGTNAKEARFWLRHFQKAAEPCHPFAIIQLEPDILQEPAMLEKLASSVAFLHRHSMKCVIVHGAPNAQRSDLTEALAEMSVFSMQLVSILEHHGALARPLFAGNGVLTAERSSGNAGSLSKVSPRMVKWALRSGHVPILQCVGQSPTGELSLLDVDHTTAELSKVMNPLKVMFVNSTGGITNDNGKVVANVNLPSDMESITNESWYTPPVQDKVKFISRLLEALPSHSSVVITSAQSLLTELFTHHGSGTFFKIMDPMLVYTSISEVDTKRLEKLIEKGFGRELEKDYFDWISSRLHSIYLIEGYSGAAIILRNSETGVPYLDKFVVLTTNQGENVGQMLWDKLKKDLPSLYWRSRNSNLINPWYFQRAEGSWTNGSWTVFWYGCATHKASSFLIDDALSLPSSFKTHNAPTQIPVANIAFGK